MKAAPYPRRCSPVSLSARYLNVATAAILVRDIPTMPQRCPGPAVRYLIPSCPARPTYQRYQRIIQGPVQPEMQIHFRASSRRKFYDLEGAGKDMRHVRILVKVYGLVRVRASTLRR